ncbi:helix-turn-helix domain-containing protein [Flavobacterium crassostreae]
MNVFDQNIINLIDILIMEKKISSKNEFYAEIKLQRQTITKIKNGTNHFTSIQIDLICKKYNVNANWIFGLEKNVFFNLKNH